MARFSIFLLGSVVALTVATGCGGCDDAGNNGAADAAADTGEVGDAMDDVEDTMADDATTADADDAGDTTDAFDADEADASDTGGDTTSDAADASDAHAEDADDASQDTAADGTDAVDDTSDTAPDTGSDASGDTASNPTGLTTPCQNGSGWTMFRFHYDSGSTSPRIDVWDASCSYSLANQACQIQEVTYGTGDISRTSGGFPIVDSSSEWIRVRFSASGLSFSSATVHVKGRSYSTVSSTRARIESPLYGSRTSGLIDNDWTYDWYAVDWTGYVNPSDDPGLTAIDVFAEGGSSELAVESVELCVE